MRTLCFALAFVSFACASVTEDPLIGSPDRVVFDQRVYPILVRDCGHSGCHGSDARFFRVVGPGHVRLDPTMRLADPVTESELALSYNRARSLLDAGDPNKSALLLKPLEVSAGGSEHEGTDSFGRNVYHSPEDPDFQVLVRWALGAL
ncbi:MAG TPA: hypothetical protein VFN67_23220 [Polyangiales bacterium]|nr:hypothetical protein [Polyangiales bacterium]